MVECQHYVNFIPVIYIYIVADSVSFLFLLSLARIDHLTRYLDQHRAIATVMFPLFFKHCFCSFTSFFCFLSFVMKYIYICPLHSSSPSFLFLPSCAYTLYILCKS
ncbi:hypothetical protein BDZ91DRAFT_53584 [Kalaharituber pfeilii]|nr:hypothetical protein BDZ91DRAFT_53584 [Kalaharituber pfeilii]